MVIQWKTYHSDTSQHGTDFSQLFREGTGIDTVNGRYLVLFQPIGETPLGRPMRVFPRVRGYDQSGDMNLMRFHESRQSQIIQIGFIGDAVISNEWVRQDQDLSLVGRIGQGLGISHHPSGEDHFSRGIGHISSEGITRHDGTIGQKQGRRVGLIGGRRGNESYH